MEFVEYVEPEAGLLAFAFGLLLLVAEVSDSSQNQGFLGH